MAKGVLGNDPFRRGAAQRPDAKVSTEAQVSIREPKVRKPPRTESTPAARTASFKGATAGGANRPARAAVQAMRSGPVAAPSAPLPPPPPPRLTSPDEGPTAPVAAGKEAAKKKKRRLSGLLAEVVAGPTHPIAGPAPAITAPLARPSPHPASPEGIGLEGPVPHPNSPEGVRAPASAPGPHVNSPVGIGLEGPVPHPNSPVGFPPPSVPAPHANSPMGIGLEGPVPHPNSPLGLPAAPRASPVGFPGGDDPRLVAAPGTFRGAIEGLAHAARVGLGLGGSEQVDRWGKDPELSARLKPVADFMLDRYWRLAVEGAEHLSPGPCLVIANHSGALPLDGAVLGAALHRARPDLPAPRWLIEDQIFDAPVVGLVLARLGAVRANPENAVRLLREGRPVLVFPEGVHGLSKPFGQRYHLQRFGRGGFVKLAVRERVPIIPAAVVGAEESMPLMARLPGGWLGLPWLPVTPPPLPARWQIRLGPAIDLSDAPQDRPEDDLAWVQRANDRTRDTIEGLLQSMLRARQRVF